MTVRHAGKIKWFSLPVLLSWFFAGGSYAHDPAVRAVVNAASLEPRLAPGGNAIILGQQFAPRPCQAEPPLPRRLCNVQVFVGDRTATLAAVATTELRIQIPVDAEPGQTEVVVDSRGELTEPVVVNLEAYAPALHINPEEDGNLGLFRDTENSIITSVEPASPGGILSVFATGLGPTDPLIPTGRTGEAPTLTKPRLAIDCFEPAVLSSALDGDLPGVYKVDFLVPEDVPGGNRRMSLTIGGHTSNEVILPVSGDEVPAVCSAVNGASFEPGLPAAAGSIMSLFAANIGGEETVDAFPATEFNGLSVTFNGLAAPLFAVVPAAGQINVLAPAELPETGEVAVRVANRRGRSTAFTLRMSPASPGIFTLSDPANPGRVFAAATVVNTRWLAIPAATAEALGLATGCSNQGIDPASFCAQPAAPGDVISVFATGLGRATPRGENSGAVLPTGQLATADPLFETVLTPSATFGGVSGRVLFSGLAPGFAGLYQINVEIPSGAPAGDAVPMTVSMPNGLSDSASIALQP